MRGREGGREVTPLALLGAHQPDRALGLRRGCLERAEGRLCPGEEVGTSFSASPRLPGTERGSLVCGLGARSLLQCQGSLRTHLPAGPSARGRLGAAGMPCCPWTGNPVIPIVGGARAPLGFCPLRSRVLSLFLALCGSRCQSGKALHGTSRGQGAMHPLIQCLSPGKRGSARAQPPQGHTVRDGCTKSSLQLSSPFHSPELSPARPCPAPEAGPSTLCAGGGSGWGQGAVPRLPGPECGLRPEEQFSWGNKAPGRRARGG